MSGPATPTPPVSPSYRIVADDLRKGCYLFSAPGDATPFTKGLVVTEAQLHKSFGWANQNGGRIDVDRLLGFGLIVSASAPETPSAPAPGPAATAPPSLAPASSADKPRA
jgi:hypothetical protein